jgi:hypothetical protein
METFIVMKAITPTAMKRITHKKKMRGKQSIRPLHAYWLT